jgi:hypothetical protein
MKGQKMFNVSTKKVGGIRFLKLGKLCLSFCVTEKFKPIGEKS